MTDNEKAAYINSQVACAMIKAMGMQATNQQRVFEGVSIDYSMADFANLELEYQIGCNDVIGYLRGKNRDIL